MSAANRGFTSLVLCALTLGPIAATASAQSRDPLPDVRERLKIESQRVEKEIHDGRMRAYRLLRSDPEGAFDAIKGLIGMLRKDTSLSEERRDTLMSALKRDISSLRALSSVRRTNDPVTHATTIDIRRTTDPRVGADRKSAADAAAERINRLTGQVADIRSVRTRGGDRFAGAMDRVDKTATLPASDYDFPADWRERTKKRSAHAKLTAAEKAILAALKKPVKVDYNMQTFQGVIDHLSTQMGLTLIVEKQALDEANVTYDSPITLRFNKPVSARTALKRVLADLGLTYVIRKEHIEVTTIARAKEMLTTRTYYIADLLPLYNPFVQPIINQQQTLQAIGMILSSVQGIDPESWDTRGGPGSITYDPIRMAIIVKQTAEMHYMLDSAR